MLPWSFGTLFFLSGYTLSFYQCYESRSGRYCTILPDTDPRVDLIFLTCLNFAHSHISYISLYPYKSFKILQNSCCCPIMKSENKNLFGFCPVWRIRDVYPGSRILILPIPDPGSRIPDPGSRIQKQVEKRGVKKILLSNIFL